MIIKKITKQKNGKYKLTLENNEIITTYDEVILENNLLQNKQIDDRLSDKIKSSNNYYEVYNKVIKYISIKMRSRKEVEDYLNKFDLTKDEKKQIILKLESTGLLNDKIFTKSFIMDRFNLSNDGPLLIKKDLLKHNIDINLIEENLTNITQEQIETKINKLIAKKIKINHKYSDQMLKKRITKDLTNLGFDYNLVIENLSNYEIDDDSYLIKEFEKAYNKYSKKLDNDKLIYKLRQVLYQKGFELEKINKLLNEKNVQS